MFDQALYVVTMLSLSALFFAAVVAFVGALLLMAEMSTGAYDHRRREPTLKRIWKSLLLLCRRA